MNDLIGRIAKITVANEPYFGAGELCTITSVDEHQEFGRNSYWGVFLRPRVRGVPPARLPNDHTFCIGWKDTHFEVVDQLALSCGLSYDFHGINGTDAFRTRLCTLTKDADVLPQSEKDILGHLLAAAPDMYQAIKLATVSCGFKRLNLVAQCRLLEALALAEKGMNGP